MLRLIVQGHTNQEIAERLFLSINSIKTYIRTTYRKLGVRTRQQAVTWAIQHGFPIAPDAVRDKARRADELRPDLRPARETAHPGVWRRAVRLGGAPDGGLDEAQSREPSGR